MMLDDRQRKLRFINTNGLVRDAKTEHAERAHFNVWTQQEKDIFKEKFLLHPKNFVFIASFLERKVRFFSPPSIGSCHLTQSQH